MGGRQVVRVLLYLCVTMLVGSGCVSLRELAGYPKQNDPSVAIRATEPRWLLIKNPRFGDVPSEPEYIWVEEDKVPFTFKGLVLGKSRLLAPPEIVAKYGSPPGGGRISPRQGGAYRVENLAPPPSTSTGQLAAVPSSTRSDGGAGAVAQPQRGFVVFVDTTRVVIDLSARDGVKLGSLVSLRRDKITIVHPITGEILGELDEEVATGRVTEVRDKFSVIELQNVSGASPVKVKDRAVVR